MQPREPQGRGPNTAAGLFLWGQCHSALPTPPCPPTVRKNGPFELPSLEVTEVPLPRLCSWVGVGQSASCCPGTTGSTGPVVWGGGRVLKGQARGGGLTGQCLWTPLWESKQQASLCWQSGTSPGREASGSRVAPSWLQASTPSLLVVPVLPESVLSQNSPTL